MNKDGNYVSIVCIFFVAFTEIGYLIVVLGSKC